MYEIKGHHHISMVTKNANENNHFYIKRAWLTSCENDSKPR